MTRHSSQSRFLLSPSLLPVSTRIVREGARTAWEDGGGVVGIMTDLFIDRLALLLGYYEQAQGCRTLAHVGKCPLSIMNDALTLELPQERHCDLSPTQPGQGTLRWPRDLDLWSPPLPHLWTHCIPYVQSHIAIVQFADSNL